MIIREATVHDAKRLKDIYSYYVENTAISFEWKAPSVRELGERIENTLKQYPYIVAEDDGEIVGYCYAGPLKTRKSYFVSAEVSIYVDKNKRGNGCGKLLYVEIEKRLKAMGVENLYACIASPVTDDEYLTHNSENFHAHMGYAKIAEFHKCAVKFGRYYNMIWMEKFLINK